MAIARALVHDPPVLLADEPTGNLDSATGEQILDLFSALHARGKTVLMVTHNPANLSRATRSLRLRDGRVEEDRLLRPFRGAGGGLNAGLREERTGRWKRDGMQESSECRIDGNGRCGGSALRGRPARPDLEGWVLSILVAIILSVTATLLLGGSGRVPVGSRGGGSGGVGRSRKQLLPAGGRGEVNGTGLARTLIKLLIY